MSTHAVDSPNMPYENVYPVNERSIFQRLWHITFNTSGMCYFAGGWLFLIGSILFYPRYANIYDIEGQGPLIGGWLFLFGCVGFLVGSFIEVYNARGAHTDGADWLRFIPISTAVSNVIGSVCFVYGGVYFLPKYYNLDPALGCYLFVAGCTVFSFAIFIDIPRMIRASQPLLSAWTVCAIFNMLGNILFIVGSYYFLPKFLYDEVNGVDNLVYSTNIFVVGSIAFIIAPIAQLIGLYQDLVSLPLAKSVHA